MPCQWLATQTNWPSPNYFSYSHLQNPFFPFILREFHIKTTIISYDEDTVSLGRIVDTYSDPIFISASTTLATVQTIAIIINSDFEVSD